MHTPSLQSPTRTIGRAGEGIHIIKVTRTPTFPYSKTRSAIVPIERRAESSYTLGILLNEPLPRWNPMVVEPATERDDKICASAPPFLISFLSSLTPDLAWVHEDLEQQDFGSVEKLFTISHWPDKDT